MIKRIFCYIMFTIPLILVLITLLNATTIDDKGTEYRFRIQQYDPYDIIRGRFLNVALENREVYIDELIGFTSYSNDNYEYNKFNKLIIDLYNNNNSEERKFVFEKINEIIQIFINYENAYDISRNYNETDNLKKLFYEIGVIDELDTSNVDYTLNDVIYDLYEPLTSIALNDRTFEELFEIFETNYSNYSAYSEEDREKFKANIENRKYYMQIENDDEGYAKFTNIVDDAYKIDANCEYITIGINHSYNDNLIRTFNIRMPDIKYYADERYSREYENSINYAMRENDNVYALIKVYDGSMIIKNIMIDDMTLDDYYKNVYKNSIDVE